LNLTRFPNFVGSLCSRTGWPAFLFVFAATCGLLTGCASVSGIPADPMGAQYGDRCYIEDSQFAFADQLYDRVGSLQLVDQELCNYYQWKRCEINEALYRLRKVHDLP
jgi:hypothetical protein